MQLYGCTSFHAGIMNYLTRTFVAAVCAATISTPALAVFPDSGMWTIGDELNGKPGRGLQIDRQGGKTLIVSYFGYRPDGTSMFLQASGVMQDSKTFSADLIEYRNGRALGGEARDGEEAQIAGTVTIRFTSATTGSITLPGEVPQKVARFQFEDTRARLNVSTFSYTAVQYYGSLPSPGRITFKAGSDTLEIQEQMASGVKCDYRGSLVPAGRGFRSVGDADCSDSPGQKLRYRAEDIYVDEFGMLSGRIHLFLEGALTVGNAFASLRSLTGVCRNSGPVFDAQGRCPPGAFGFTHEDVFD